MRGPSGSSSGSLGTTRQALLLSIIAITSFGFGYNSVIFRTANPCHMPDEAVSLLGGAPEALGYLDLERQKETKAEKSHFPASKMHKSKSLPLIPVATGNFTLKRDIKVYMFKPDDFVRDQPGDSGLYYYMVDGILEHPHVHFVDTLDEADVYLHLVLHTNITSDKRFIDSKLPGFEKLVVVDENDYFSNVFHALFSDYRHLAFFKRSYLKKGENTEPEGVDFKTGKRDLSYGYWPMKHNFYPFSYGLARRYIQALWNEQEIMEFDKGEGRDIPVVCTLREYHKPAWDGGRKESYNWLRELNTTQQIKGMVLGEVDDWIQGNRDRSSPRYVDIMKRAKIIVTANPGKWEGDFRFWEAMASKALIFTDYMFVEVPHFFKDGEDFIVFDHHDKDGFVKKVKYYLEHEEEARRIAMNGYYKAVKYHRYVNRIDYMFNTIDHLLDPAYKETGMFMKEQMMRAEKHMFQP